MEELARQEHQDDHSETTVEVPGALAETDSVDSLTCSELSGSVLPVDVVMPSAAPESRSPRDSTPDGTSPFSAVFVHTEDEEPELMDLVRPPLMPGAPEVRPEQAQDDQFDGHWVMCSPKGTVSTWLYSLTIDGMQVVDGLGGLCRLKKGRRGPKLFGGTLKVQGDMLYRCGKSGCVQVYERAN